MNSDARGVSFRARCGVGLLGLRLAVACAWLAGCGGLQEGELVSTMMLPLRVVLDTDALADDELKVLRQSDFTGDISVVVWSRWPPWTLQERSSMFSMGTVITASLRQPFDWALDTKRFFLPLHEGQQLFFVATIRPALVKLGTTTSLYGIGVRAGELTSTGLCGKGCRVAREAGGGCEEICDPRESTACTATCEPAESGRGIPVLLASTGTPPPRVTIRINRAIAQASPTAPP